LARASDSPPREGLLHRVQKDARCDLQYTNAFDKGRTRSNEVLDADDDGCFGDGEIKATKNLEDPSHVVASIQWMSRMFG